MSVHAHGGRRDTQAEAPGRSPGKTPDTMLWNLLMDNGLNCQGPGHPAPPIDHLMPDALREANPNLRACHGRGNPCPVMYYNGRRRGGYLP